MNRTKLDEGTSYHVLFHRNMSVLMMFNKTPSALKACYKEGMFAVPNQEGFAQVSHFLFNLIYPQTKAFANCWPVLDRSQEREFRKTVFELMRGLNNDFSDILQFPDVIASQLMSPGNRFIKLAWKLSMLAMAVLARRESGCYLHKQPTGKEPVQNREVSTRLRQCSTQKNYKECKEIVKDLESVKETYEKTKKKALSTMMKKKEEIQDQEIFVNQLLKDAGVEDDLIKKLMDLKSDEGITVLKERVGEKNEFLQKAYVSWKECADQAKACKTIITAATEERGNKPKIVLDASDMICHPKESESLLEAGAVSVQDKVSMIGPVSLLKTLGSLRDELKSLKLDCPTNDLSPCLEKWESLYDDEMQMANKIKNLEAELEKKVLELSSGVNNGMENCTFMTDNQNGEIEKQPLQSPSILNLGSLPCASTPVKGESMSYFQSHSEAGAMNVTPYQLPSNENYFADKLKLVQKTISDEKKCAKMKHMKPDIPVIKIDSPTSRQESSLSSILERFRKVQESMKSSCSSDKMFDDDE